MVPPEWMNGEIRRGERHLILKVCHCPSVRLSVHTRAGCDLLRVHASTRYNFPSSGDTLPVSLGRVNILSTRRTIVISSDRACQGDPVTFCDSGADRVKCKV